MIKAYLRAFINCEQNNWVKLLPIAEFAYNNAKNASTANPLLECNDSYHLKVSFKEDLDHCLRSYSTNGLVDELEGFYVM